MLGSGGREVARLLSERLSIKAYNKELLLEAAKESGISEHLFKNCDEKRNLLSIISAFASGGINSMGGHGFVESNRLFQIQSEVIRDIADRESAIFIGRCADYVLRDRNRLSVFITATDEDRIKRVAGSENIDFEEAEAMVRKKERERRDYYNNFTLGNWGEASNYDLCINTSKTGIEGAVELILALAGENFPADEKSRHQAERL